MRNQRALKLYSTGGKIECRRPFQQVTYITALVIPSKLVLGLVVEATIVILIDLFYDNLLAL